MPSKRRTTKKKAERVMLGLRVTPELKNRLDAAAEQSGRSQSQEAEFRLERSFDRNDLLFDTLSLAFGKQAAGIVLAIACAMSRTGSQQLDLGPGPMRSLSTTSWTDDPASLEAGLLAGVALLAMFRPTGTGKSITAKDRFTAFDTAHSYFHTLRKEKFTETTHFNFVSEAAWRRAQAEITAIRTLLGPTAANQLRELSVSDLTNALRWLADDVDKYHHALTDYVRGRGPRPDEHDDGPSKEPRP